MRRLTPILAALLLAAPLPAAAQVTARYTAGKSEIRIDAMPSGDYRVDVDAKSSVLRLDGVEYVVLPGRDGSPKVAKIRDLIAAISAEMKKVNSAIRVTPVAPGEGEDPLAEDEAGEGEAAVAAEPEVEVEPETTEVEVTDGEPGTPIDDGVAIPTPPMAPPPLAMNFALTRMGEESVAGFAGEIWSFGPERPAGAPSPLGGPNPDKLLVMSKDPRLAPLRPPFELLVEVVGLFIGAIPHDGNMAETFAELATKGVPIRVDTVMTLKSVETAPIDPSRFELPGPVMQAMDFMAATGGPGSAPSFEPEPLP